MPTRVTVWNEHFHEQEQSRVDDIYPDGIYGALAEALEEDERVFEIRMAILHDEPDHGLSEAVLQETDVLVRWAHAAHDRVADEGTDRVK